MKKTITDDLIREAAELRAQGLSWEQVGQAVKRTASRVRNWPREYPERWRAAMGRAEAEMSRSAAAEGRNELRHQLRDENKVIRRVAAVTLMKDHNERAKKKPSRRTKQPRASARAIRLAEYVEGLSDAELEEHLRELSERPEPAAASAGDVQPGVEVAPVAAGPERVS